MYTAMDSLIQMFSNGLQNVMHNVMTAMHAYRNKNTKEFKRELNGCIPQWILWYNCLQWAAEHFRIHLS